MRQIDCELSENEEAVLVLLAMSPVRCLPPRVERLVVPLACRGFVGRHDGAWIALPAALSYLAKAARRHAHGSASRH